MEQPSLEQNIYQLIANVGMLRLLLALCIGLLIGWEREYRDGIPGLRVLPLVTVGATLFTLYGGVEGKAFANPALAAGVVTGVGFLGAGFIIKERGVLSGLTTAAAIWVTAALGMGIGLGLYAQVAFVTAAVLLILWGLPTLSQAHHSFVYEAVAPYSEERYRQFQCRFEERRLKIMKHTLSRSGEEMICVWYATGQPEQHKDLSRAFLNDPEVAEFNIN
jgi:putative Mg2+ transporter-C (MgtC) family protein